MGPRKIGRQEGQGWRLLLCQRHDGFPSPHGEGEDEDPNWRHHNRDSHLIRHEQSKQSQKRPARSTGIRW